MSDQRVCPATHKHALTLNCYQKHGCRCTPCRTRNTEVSRAWREGRRLEPDPFAVDIALEGGSVHLSREQRIEAVHRLWVRQWSDAAIAEQIGISERTVLRIRHRNGWRGLQKWEMQKMKEAA